MSTYVDVETSAEGILEEEELIEAVEALVNQSFINVKREIINDWTDFQQQILWAIDRLFPIQVEYRNGTRSVTDDLHKVGFAALLLLIAVLILAPSQRQRSGNNKRRPPWILKRSRSDSWSPQNLNVNHSPGQSMGSSSYAGDSSEGIPGTMDDETDEERFEKKYPKICVSNYRKLVLPPSCRRVEKRAPQLTASSSAKKDAAPRKERRTQRGDALRGSGVSQNSVPAAEDEENPAQRLQNYFRSFLFLLKSIITYEYAGAGGIVVLWWQGFRRHRKTNLEQEEEEAASIVEPLTPQVDPSAHTHPETESTKADDDSMVSSLVPPSPDRAMDPFLNDESSRKGFILSPVAEGSDINTSENESRTSPPLVPYNFDESKTPSIPVLAAKHSTPSHDLTSLERMTSDKTVYHDILDDNRNSLDGDTSKDSLLSSFTGRKRREESVQNMIELNKKIPPVDSGSIESTTAATTPTPTITNASEFSSPLFTATQQPDMQPSPLSDQQDQSAISLRMELSKSASSIQEQEISDDEEAKSSGLNFFETAHSHDTLKKFSIEVPVPDKNGYILGDEYLPDSSRYTPLLVFVNSRAGPQQGHLLITQLRRLLNPIQIWDLANGGPETVLESFIVLSHLRILVCGGDGTVSWIVRALDDMDLPKNRKRPPIAILPLGTGNDLARIHGWGGGYNNESLIMILEQISESYISLLDRWDLTIDGKQAKKAQSKTFFNYLGVGADAQAALQVHYLRESKPQWFFSRIVNKAWYGVFGAEDLIMASSVNVRKDIKLYADGVEISLPPDSQGIILLNIDSYAGGVPLWSHGTKEDRSYLQAPRSPRRSQSMHMLSRRSHSIDRADSLDDLQTILSEEEKYERVTACDRPSSCQDGVLDVVSIRGAFHLGQIKVGLSNAQRLCQCREAKIIIKNKVAVQIDGEPWRQKPCTLIVKRKPEPAIMLHRSADDGGVETEMSKLLDWAEERQIIDPEAHSILMKEFSRRIESKTRRRRQGQNPETLVQTVKKALSQGHMNSSYNWQGGIAF